MATTYRPNTKAGKPATGDNVWNVPNDANWDLFEAAAAVAGLCVTPSEIPSSTLRVDVAPGNYRKTDATVGTYAGATAVSVTASLANQVYLDDAGVLHVVTTGWPVTPHVRLATVTAGVSSVTSVADARVVLHSLGAAVSLALTGGTFNDSGGVVTVHTGTANGTMLGGGPTEKFGLWGATPVVQPSGASQSAVGTLALQTLAVSTGGSASTTLAAATNTAALTDSTGGSASTTLAAITDTATKNAVASLAAQLATQLALNTVLINSVTSLGTQLDNALADLNSLKTLVNALRSADVAAGRIKGSA